MSAPRIRLLVLSVGSLAAQSFVDALGTRRAECVLIGTNSIADAAGNFRCDVVHLVPPAASGAVYVDRIAEIVEQERPDLVIPGRDDDVLALAVLGERRRTREPVLLAGSVAAARVWNDKVETARFAARQGLPFAPTAETLERALDLVTTHTLPLIGKPRSGNGARGVVILRSIAEISRAFERTDGLIVQPFLDPPADVEALVAPFETGLPFFFSFPETSEYTVQIVIGPDGATSRPFGCLNTMVAGQAIQYRRCDDTDLLDVGVAYARSAAAAGWRGSLNVQLKRNRSGALEAHEVNGRCTGGTAPRALLGFDEPAELFARFLPQARFTPNPPSVSRVVQVQPYAYPLSESAVDTLHTRRKWARD